MATFKNERSTLKIEIDTTGMQPNQVRLLKTINSLLSNVINSDDESEYFELSAELMKQIASAIKQSHFTSDLKSNGIPYAEQALEYSMDLMHEHMAGKRVVSYDN